MATSALPVNVLYLLEYGECHIGGLSPPFLSDFAVLSSSQARYLRGMVEAKSILLNLPAHFFNLPTQERLYYHLPGDYRRLSDSTLVVPGFYGVVGLSTHRLRLLTYVLVHRKRCPKLTYVQ